MGVAAEPPHQAPGHSPAQSELRDRQSAPVRALPPQRLVHILQAGAWSPHQGPGWGENMGKMEQFYQVHKCKLRK